MINSTLRPDQLEIVSLVPNNCTLLDVCCGDGALLAHLRDHKNVKGRGLEISQTGVSACLSKGLPVIQGDADIDLEDYPDNAFDMVILSQALQAMHRPVYIVNQLLRIGKQAIVSFPNFGHFEIRSKLFFGGHMPDSKALPYSWYDTPNIHLCTIADFRKLCNDQHWRIIDYKGLRKNGTPLSNKTCIIHNLLAASGIFLVEKYND